MKHIETINEWFGKKLGDDFIEELIKVIKEENIEIKNSDDDFWFRFDDVTYSVDFRYKDWSDDMIIDYYYLEVRKEDNNSSEEYKISGKYYRKIKSMWKKQFNEREKERLKLLPKISKEDRTAKKYNL